MAEKANIWRVASTRNRAEPLLGSGMAVGATSDKVWHWGDNNMLPYALSLIARNSVAHRRIINDKADYIAGKGIICDEELTLVRQLIARANGSGETLRSVISLLALDEAMF